MEELDSWDLATVIEEDNLSRACIEMKVALSALKAEMFNPKTTVTDIDAAIRDLFALGMLCGSHSTLQEVIDRLGQEAFLQLV